MLDIIATALVSALEKELAEHGPELEKLVVEQLDKLTQVLFDYLQERVNNLSNEDKPKELENKD